MRGTAKLVKGRALVEFPEHFLAVASQDGMTVQLTPRSAESLGLATVSLGLDGLVVQELHNGNGNYLFDWEVKAVRRGFEDYQVVRPKPQ